jgi:hypothetical protein
MNIHHVTDNNPFAFDADTIAHIANPLFPRSFISLTDMGDALYEWMDNQVETLSSVRPGEMLCRTEYRGFTDSCFMKAARQQLIKQRGSHK